MAFAAVCVFAGCGENDKSKDNASATPDEANQTETVENTTEAPLKTYEIETKYAKLKYPERWKDTVKASINDGEPYSVTFSAGDQKLFTLYFNSAEGDAVGTLIRDDVNTVVSVSTEPLNPKAKKYSDYKTMQEDVNVIFQNLREDYEFTEEVIGDVEESVYEIKTDLTTLYYPTRWKDKVTVKSEKDKITFSSEDTPLFAFVIGSDDGIPVGTYDGKSISVIDYPVKTKEQANMQEDLNVVIRNLEKDKKFTPID